MLAVLEVIQTDMGGTLLGKSSSVVFTNLYTRFVPLEIYWLMGGGPSHAPLSIIDDKL